MREWLRSEGFGVNRKRVVRLMGGLGLEGLRPRRSFSRAGAKPCIYPYLLRGVVVLRRDQVWCTDITYVRMPLGFLYLVAIMDWFSRYVVSWALSNTLDGSFCVEALERALALGSPEIFNSDHGAQFTSVDFTGRLARRGVRISMDGRGRVYDNIFIERLWRTVKYEEVYLKDYQTVREASSNLTRYFSFYNEERPHQALSYRAPAQVYRG
jgi:putative transposase